MLHKIGACDPAIEWVAGHNGNSSECWRDCERGDWMAWIVAKMEGKFGITRQTLVFALCDCAELSLHIFEEKYPDDKRPRMALDVTRKWANGEATDNELKKAADAADAAYAAYAAYAAAYAAHAAHAAYAAAYAAHAAYAAAHAAYAAYAAYAADARKGTLKQCADIFRKHFSQLGETK